MDKEKKKASDLFLDHFSGHSKYEAPTNWDIEVMSKSNRYVAILVTEEGNRRRGKFIFEYGVERPLVEYYSGQLGGNWSGEYQVNLDDEVWLDGRGAERDWLNLGYQGEVRNIILNQNTVSFLHTYKTKGWIKKRKWDLLLEV